MRNTYIYICIFVYVCMYFSQIIYFIIFSLYWFDTCTCLFCVSYIICCHMTISIESLKQYELYKPFHNTYRNHTWITNKKCMSLFQKLPTYNCVRLYLFIIGNLQSPFSLSNIFLYKKRKKNWMGPIHRPFSWDATNKFSFRLSVDILLYTVRM